MDLPHRFTKESFRFYEPMIAQIVTRFPLVTTFDPAAFGRSIETFAPRLRDAMTSYKLYNWVSLALDPRREHFLSIYPQIKVCMRPPHVVVGSKESIRAHDTPESKVTVPSLPTKTSAGNVCYIANPLTLEESLFALRLAHERALGVTLSIIFPDGFDLEWALATYDIDLSPGEENGRYHLT